MVFTRSEETGSRVDSVLEYLAFQMTGIPTDLNQPSLISSYGPPNDTFVNILGVLDGLGRDVIQSILIEFRFQMLFNSRFNPGSNYSYRQRNVLIWDSSEDERSAADRTRFIYQSNAEESYSLQNMTNSTLHLEYPYSSFTNILVAVRDAIQ